MRRDCSRALGVGVAVLLLAGGVARANPPVEAFGSLPLYDGWAVSADGKHLAAIRSEAGRPVVLIYEIGAQPGTKPSAFPSDHGVAREVRWLSSDRVVAYYSTNIQFDMDRVSRQWAQAISISADGKHAALLPAGPTQPDLDDPESAFVAGDSVFRISAISQSEGRLLESGISTTIGWIIDGHGNRLARIDRPQRNGSTYTVASGGSGNWKVIATLDASYRADLSIDGATMDGQGVALVRYGSGDKRSLDRLDLTSGTITSLLADPGYDVSSTIADEWSGRIIGARLIGDRPQARYFEPGWAALQSGLEGALPGLNVSILSSDMSTQHLVVQADGPRQPPVFLLYDRATKHASVLANAYPQLTASDLGEVRPYTYKASDGTEIHGYLTLPPGVTDPKNLPLVVFPHGGPETRDYIQFDWWAQFMANRGYLVFQPNFRGSSGYGSALLRAGDGQYGHKMISDISDGTRKLIADGIADPKKVCIVGASYGGYAALMGATFSPGLYACAASYAGFGDVQELFSFDMRAAGNDKDFNALWKRRVGAELSDSAALAEISPAMHADAVRAPVLLMHSLKDVTVPASQSVQERDALKKAGKDVEYAAFDGDDHYLSLSNSRTQMLTRLEGFLAKYLK
jgi:dienelactone hydrolase